MTPAQGGPAARTEGIASSAPRPQSTAGQAGEQTIVLRAGMGRRAGLGKRPALLIIDMQVYMMGDIRQPIDQSILQYPSSCGEAAWAAADHIKRLLSFFHQKGWPVIYTQQTLKADGSDAGPYKKKRAFLASEHWLIQGTHGWQIAPAIAPAPGDIVLQKKRPSAFFGTGFLGLLRDAEVDTLVVTGGSVCNCVRATVFDSASYDFNTIVVRDAVCDRLPRSAQVNLEDMDRQFADVMPCAEVLSALQKIDVEQTEKEER